MAQEYQVWYMKPDWFRDGSIGRLPEPSNLGATHVFLKSVEANNLEHLFQIMQGEVWSPNGEARSLIESKGLGHTSMSVGDVVIDDIGEAFIVSQFGFTMLDEDEVPFDPSFREHVDPYDRDDDE